MQRSRATILTIAALVAAGCGDEDGGGAGTAATNATVPSAATTLSGRSTDATAAGTTAGTTADGVDDEPAPLFTLSITSPDDGAAVVNPVRVSAEAQGLTVEPAGAVRVGAGHFHLMIDTACVAAGSQIPPEDGAHVHLDDGAAEAELTLLPGEHDICLQAGDGQHAALGPIDEIAITVAAPPGDTAPTFPPGEEPLNAWDGEYRGDVVWDCGPVGERRGSLAAVVTILESTESIWMYVEHTVTGSCAGPDSGSLTTTFAISGTRTSSGYQFPSDLWGPPGTFTIRTGDDTASGRLEGPTPDPGTVTIDFELTRYDGF